MISYYNIDLAITKEEALEAMVKGEKVAHYHFDDHEWMKQTGHLYEFEDGILCKPVDFWSTRTNPAWEKDWMVVE